jgi:hypothetical protein
MNGQLSYETDGFELDTEGEQFGELDTPMPVSRKRGGCSCGCGRRSARALNGVQPESFAEESELSLPRWLNPVYRLYRAGRLGWRAGRFVDKLSGKVLGKPISKMGADFLYRRLGRSRRLEDFFDSLPPRVKRWLNQI